jgi:hypothetical protein
MTVIVETGETVANANSYVSEATLVAFALARGVTLTTDSTELLIKAMDYIDSLDYIGIKKNYTQTTQWPRYDVWIDGYNFYSDQIPQELKNAQCLTAMAIEEGTDPLANLARTVTQETIGNLSVSYASSGASQELNIKIGQALRKLLKGGWTGGNTFKCVK